MTRSQIVSMTRETGQLVQTNKTGVAPRSQKHLRRLEELKRARELEKAHEGYEPSLKRA